MLNDDTLDLERDLTEIIRIADRAMSRPDYVDPLLAKRLRSVHDEARQARKMVTMRPTQTA